MRIFIGSILLLCVACSNNDTFIDKRDGQKYKTIQIGDQVWIAENLNYEIENSWCNDDDPANCEVYGRLYNWEAAIEACPDGWHLPTDGEWIILRDYLEGPYDTGGKMKEAGQSHWAYTENGVTNESGFTGLPGGYRLDDGNFGSPGDFGYWWSATEIDDLNAFSRTLTDLSVHVFRLIGDKERGYSVRYIQD